jgi:hypothetical protein
VLVDSSGSQVEVLRRETDAPTTLMGRGTKSGKVGGDSGFADAIAAVMRLPLSDAEKAEAVRRLMR